MAEMKVASHRRLAVEMEARAEQKRKFEATWGHSGFETLKRALAEKREEATQLRREVGRKNAEIRDIEGVMLEQKAKLDARQGMSGRAHARRKRQMYEAATRKVRADVEEEMAALTKKLAAAEECLEEVTRSDSGSEWA